MKKNPFLFWQPRYDFLAFMESTQLLKILLVFLNYAIWVFLFYISYLLISQNINLFWEILTATLISELIEKKIKKKVYWRRPLFIHRHTTPPGLVDRWYNTGSFPSGHTIKAVLFFLLLIATPVFSPFLYLLIVIPLLFFRILIGFIIQLIYLEEFLLV
jgi:membrane-associated phospholipid phosphatase